MKRRITNTVITFLLVFGVYGCVVYVRIMDKLRLGLGEKAGICPL